MPGLTSSCESAKTPFMTHSLSHIRRSSDASERCVQRERRTKILVYLTLTCSSLLRMQTAHLQLSTVDKNGPLLLLRTQEQIDIHAHTHTRLLTFRLVRRAILLAV
jgi:hypothetical protein